MRTADVYVSGARAGVLEELVQGHSYRFIYDDNYTGQPVSLTMPLSARSFEFDSFPPFFDGVLPEGMMLESLLKRAKIDRNDMFSQLITVGEDLIGNVQVRERS